MNTRLNAIYSWLLENRSTSSYIDGSPSQYENQGITREQGWVQEIKTGTKARKSRCACQPSGRIKLRQGMSSCQPSYMEKVQKWGPGRGERRICRRLASWRARDCQAPGMLLVLRHKDGYWHVRAHETCGRSFCKTFNQESSFVSGSQIKGSWWAIYSINNEKRQEQPESLLKGSHKTRQRQQRCHSKHKLMRTSTIKVWGFIKVRNFPCGKHYASL